MCHNNLINDLNAFSKMLLIEGLDDWVMLGYLSMAFLGQKPAIEEFVSQSCAAIEPLLGNGLMEMGDLTGPNGIFRAWGVSVDECLERFEVAYRKDPDNTGAEWAWGMWLNLTSRGKALATELEAIDPDPLGIYGDEDD